MPKPKIRLRAEKVVINGVPRFTLRDQNGYKWINGACETRQHWNIEIYGETEWTIDDENSLAALMNATGGSEGDAFQKHAPRPKDYDILPPDTDITVVCVRNTGSKAVEKYHCLTVNPFEDTVNRLSEFYAIDELSGKRTLIRYSTIEQIDFKVI
jgi:hypothetical protein